MSRKHALGRYIPFILLITHVYGQPFTTPTINLDAVGQLGFTGNYAGLSPFVDSQQFETGTSLSSLVLSNNNTYTRIASSNGDILATCTLQRTDNQMDIFIGGNFTIINNTTLHYIARFNSQTHTLTALDQGLDGPVQALYCDQETNSVYVGGDFDTPIQTSSSNASSVFGKSALWQNDAWTALPWKGFNGPVYTITANKKKKTILFGGLFDATGDGQYYNANSSQIVNLGGSTTLGSGNGALATGLGNPANIVCSNNTLPVPDTPWLLQKGVPGYWEATFAYSIQPSLFRISNTHYDGRGTNSFSIIALGSNEYFELSYLDPVTQQTVICSEECHLSNDTTIAFQDFTVVSPYITTGVRINVDSWYGSGGGLGSVQIFQSDIALHAHLGDTNGQCTSSITPSTTIVGNWVEKYVFGTYQNFLTSTFSSSDLATTDASILYTPYIPVQGQYAIYATTPGCVGSSTCNDRTQIELTVTPSPGNSTVFFVDQAVTEDTRTLIYSGFLSATTSSFQPTVLLNVATNAIAPSSGTVSLVATSLEFIKNGTGVTLVSVLEYSPQNYTLNIVPSWRPLAEQLLHGSTVRSIDASQGDVLYIGGQFVGINDVYRNIVAYDYLSLGGQLRPLNEVGLTGNVTCLQLVGSSLFAGGSFDSTVTGTQALGNVARFDLVSNKWEALGMGLDGPVESIVLSDTTITFSGKMSRIITEANSTAPMAAGNALWDITNNQWIDRSSLIVGTIRSSIPLNANDKLWIGGIRSAQTYLSSGLASLGINSIWSPHVFGNDPNAVINTGLFWHNTTQPGTNITVMIIGGKFKISDSISNLAMYKDGGWTGIGQLDGEVRALKLLNDKLLIGGEFGGRFYNSQPKSFAIYDLLAETNVDTIGVYGSGGQVGRINVIQVNGNSNIVNVAGNFSLAGSLECPSVCSLNTNTLQWDKVAQGLQGQVYDMTTFDGRMIVVGDLQVNNQHTFIAEIRDQSSTWAVPADMQSTELGIPTTLLSMPKKVLIAGSNSTSGYLGTWDGTKYTDLGSNLGPSSDIRQLLYIPITSSPNDDRFPENSEDMLMVVGHLDIAPFGNVSAALYDGSTWYPYVLTSQRDGSPGTIQHLFHESPCCTVSNVVRHLPIPAVILISIAISLGIIFTMVLCALCFVFIRRRNSVRHEPEPMPPWASGRRASTLIAMLDAAQLGVLGAGAGGYAGDTLTNKEKAGYANQNPSSEMRENMAETPFITNTHDRIGAGPVTFAAMLSAAVAKRTESGPDAPVSEDCPCLFYAKYPFDAKEYGELGFDANETIIVTDMSDNVWWMGYKDDGTGKPVSGLFPSNYVSNTKAW
ncbi:cortical protein marker for cell polarity-domain-containing protein [Phycomyces nitens]|nr:cortical protein marker for cell polarity-domain-containing protein [Phycomyces nitens]